VLTLYDAKVAFSAADC